MQKVKYHLVIVLFFLSLFTSLWLKNIYFIFGFASVSWLVLTKKKIWDNISSALFIFGIFYGLCEFYNGYVESGFVLLSHVVAPVAYYNFGKWIVQKIIESNKRLWFLTITLIVFLIQLFLLTFQDIAISGIVNESRRMLIDIGKEDNTLSATLYGLMSSVGIGAISSAFLKDLKFHIKLVLTCISLLSILVVIHLVNRTGIVILAFAIFFSFICSTKMSLSRVMPALFVFIILSIIIYNSGIIGDEMLEAYASRENERGVESSTMGGRLDLWQIAISNLLISPAGWKSVDYFSHNLWLDIARVGGWIPFIIFTVVTISVLRGIRHIIKYDNYKVEPFCVVLSTTVICVLINSSVEPVIEASNMLFFLTISFFGMVKSVEKEIQNKYHRSFKGFINTFSTLNSK